MTSSFLIWKIDKIKCGGKSMFENIVKFFKKIGKKEASNTNSRETAKERLHLVLMQDRANVSADFLDLMRQEIIEVIKKYIDMDESAMDVRLVNQENDDGTQGAPALYANIPILNIKEKAKNTKKEEEVKKDEVPEVRKSEADKTAEAKVEEAKKIEEKVGTSEIQENTNKESENE